MKVIFLDIDGVLTHTDYLNWQTRHIDPEKVLEQIPSVISLDQLDIHCKHGTGRAAEVEKWLMDHQTDGFVILDDEDHDWSDYGFDSHWIQTSWYESGLQEKDVAEAVRILQNKEVRPECT